MLCSESRGGAIAAVGGRGSGERSLLCVELSLELAEEEGIVFGADSSQEFKSDD